MHEVPSVHDGPCISLLLLLLLLLLLIRLLLLLLSFTKESSATASFPLCSLFSCRFKLMQLEEKAGYFMTQEPPGKALEGAKGGVSLQVRSTVTWRRWRQPRGQSLRPRRVWTGRPG